MKVQIMTESKFGEMVDMAGIKATILYHTPADPYIQRPYYEIWEIEKSDIRVLENLSYEDGFRWFCHSNGANRGTAYDLVTINGTSVIAWLEGSKKDRFNCLTDYFNECLGVYDSNLICGYSVYLAKTNGWSLADLWKKLEG